MAPSEGESPRRPVVTTVFVIRHAESAANAGNYFASQSDSPLSERGVEQARALVEAFATATIHAVYSSDLSRALHTVEPLAHARSLVVTKTPLLRERNMGQLTGMTFDAVKTELPEIWARLVARDPNVVPPGGESHIDLGDRVRRVLEEIVPRHRGKNIVIGSHGGTIHHLVRQLLGVHGFDLAFWLHVANASVTRIDLTETVSGAIAPRLTYANRVLPTAIEPIFP
jgi:broad specificity phosphatase PhoE